MKKILFFLALAAIWPATVQAAGIKVSPMVIDLKAKARDILKESITLVNPDNFKQTVYVFVNNISVSEGRQEFLDPARADQASSLANWMAISRGVIELWPGAKKEINFLIEVNLRAKPGMYHAVISFAPGGTRLEAEKKLREAPAATVNLEVLDDAKERLQLKKFISDKTFFSAWPVSFHYLLENIGNRALAHSGEIRVYNRRGEEVASLEANPEQLVLEPGSSRKFAAKWPGVKGLGRFKALLRLDYGSKQPGTLQDTVFFWVIPWPKLLLIFALLAAAIAAATIFWHRKFTHHV